MIKLGIIGKNQQISEYIEKLSRLDFFSFEGVFDPVFQVENISNLKLEFKIFSSFSSFIHSVDAVIFHSCEKLNYPLLKEVIRYSKPVFLKSTFHLDIDEHDKLLKLSEESGQLIQLYHPYILQKIIQSDSNQFQLPYHIKINISLKDNKDIMEALQSAVMASVMLSDSEIKKVNINALAVFGDIPDDFCVNIDFRNGSFANIVIDNLDNLNSSEAKIYTFDTAYFFNFAKNNCLKKVRRVKEHIELDISTHSIFSLEQQLEDFYYNIFLEKQPLSRVDYSSVTQGVMTEVNKKVRTIFSII